MSKKILALMLAVALFATLFVGCTPKTATPAPATTPAPAATPAPAPAPAATKGIPKDQIKVGFVYIGSATDGGFSQAHDKGRQAVEQQLGVKTQYVENVPETADCEKAIRDLIDQGCNVIYANSFNYGDYVLNVAKEYPNVYFGHATGLKQAANVSTYMGAVEEPRYLSGIAAGMKTKSNKIGYVAALPIAEVVRGINAFTLGVRSVNPTATVEVLWINTWYDPTLEKSAAVELLNRGCDVIAQHCDTTGPQIAAQEKGAFAVGYNSPSKDAAPKAYLTAPLFHWDKFYVDDVKSIIDGTWTSRDYWGGLASGMVSLDDLTDNNAPGAKEKVEDAKAKIISGELKVFAGPLKDNTGAEKVAAGSVMTLDDLKSCDWFVEGVIGNAKG